jgi:hypothetical protein
MSRNSLGINSGSDHSRICMGSPTCTIFSKEKNSRFDYWDRQLREDSAHLEDTIMISNAFVRISFSSLFKKKNRQIIWKICRVAGVPTPLSEGLGDFEGVIVCQILGTKQEYI